VSDAKGVKGSSGVGRRSSPSHRKTREREGLRGRGLCPIPKKF